MTNFCAHRWHLLVCRTLPPSSYVGMTNFCAHRWHPKSSSFSNRSWYVGMTNFCAHRWHLQVRCSCFLGAVLEWLIFVPTVGTPKNTLKSAFPSQLDWLIFVPTVGTPFDFKYTILLLPLPVGVTNFCAHRWHGSLRPHQSTMSVGLEWLIFVPTVGTSDLLVSTTGLWALKWLIFVPTVGTWQQHPIAELTEMLEWLIFVPTVGTSPRHSRFSIVRLFKWQFLCPSLARSTWSRSVEKIFVPIVGTETAQTLIFTSHTKFL